MMNLAPWLCATPCAYKGEKRRGSSTHCTRFARCFCCCSSLGSNVRRQECRREKKNGILRVYFSSNLGSCVQPGFYFFYYLNVLYSVSVRLGLKFNLPFYTKLAVLFYFFVYLYFMHTLSIVLNLEWMIFGVGKGAGKKPRSRKFKQHQRGVVCSLSKILVFINECFRVWDSMAANLYLPQRAMHTNLTRVERRAGRGALSNQSIKMCAAIPHIFGQLACVFTIKMVFCSILGVGHYIHIYRMRSR